METSEQLKSRSSVTRKGVVIKKGVAKQIRKPKQDFQFRAMVRDDVPAVHEIETLVFPSPWTIESFYQEMDVNEHSVYIVCVTEEGIIAFGGMWCVYGQAQVTNIAVHPKFQGMGIGDKLLDCMVATAKSRACDVISLEVRESNERAQSLYKKHGFDIGGIRKNYYQDNQENAIVMWVNI